MLCDGDGDKKMPTRFTSAFIANSLNFFLFHTKTIVFLGSFKK